MGNVAKTTGQRGRTVEITDEAKASLDQVVAWSGMTQKLVVARVLEWLSHLDHDTQGAIIGALPQSRRPDFARMLLERMGQEGQEPKATRRATEPGIVRPTEEGVAGPPPEELHDRRGR